MNHIYKSIFNKALGVFTAVPEFASAHGKGSERTVVGRVAKGTAGFAASALAISVGLALTSTSAVAGPGIYINDGKSDDGCLALPDASGPNVGIYGISNAGGGINVSILAPGQVAPNKDYFAMNAMAPCLSSGNAAQALDTQTNRTLFYGNDSYGHGTITNNGAKNLTLGGRLDVNSGIIGVGDRGTNGAGATNSIRMGTGTTLDDANKKENAISIGVNTKATEVWATAIGANAVASGGSASQALGYDAVASGKSAIAQGYHSHANGQSAVAIGDNAKASSIATVSIGYMANGQVVDVDKDNTPSTTKATYGTAVGHYAGADYTGTDNESITALGNHAGRYGEGGRINTAVGSHAGMYVKGSQNVAMGNYAGSGDATKKLEASNTVSIGSFAKASGENGVAMGYVSAASGIGSIALGKSAEATDQRAIAMGENARAGNEASMALGYNSSAKGSKQVSIGLGAGALKKATDAGAELATFVGHYAGADNAAATGNAQGVAVGVNAGRYGVAGIRNVAVGSNTGQTVNGDDNTSIGYNSGRSVEGAGNFSGGLNSGVFVKGSNNVALGSNAGNGTAAQALEVNNTTSIGNNAKALTDDSISIGRDSKAGKVDKFDGKKSIAIGYASEAMGSNAIALGSNAATNNGHDSIAMGTYAKTNGEKTISIGAYNTAEGAQSIVIAGNYDASTGSNRSTTTAAAKRAIVVGPESHATAEDAVAIGNKNTVASARTYVMGNNINAAAGTNDSLAFGTKAGVGGANAIALGNTAKATKENTIAQGTESVVYGKNSVSIGYKAVSGIETPTPTQTNAFSVSIGNETEAIDASTIAIGDKAKAKGGVDALAVGTQANAMTYKALAIGAYSQATGRQSTVIGNDIQGQPSIASGTRSQILGVQSNVSGDNSVSIGDTNTVASVRTYAMGNNISVSANASDSLALGSAVKVDGDSAIALGKNAAAAGNNQIAIGVNAARNTTGGANHSSVYSVAIGTNAGADNVSTAQDGNTEGVAIGYNAGRHVGTGIHNSAIGLNSGMYIQGSDNIAFGSNAGSGQKDAVLDINRTVAIGANALSSKNNAVSIGGNSKAQDISSVAIGDTATAANANSVALGARSTTSDVHTGAYTLNNSYTAAGLPVAANGTVSVGSAGKERQIQNVAAGVISATSTDAINGSQLYATNNYLSNLAGGVKNVLGGDAAVDNAGNLTMSNIGGTGKGNVNDAIAAANTKVAAGENITVTPTTNTDGSKTYTVATKKDLVVDSVKAGDTTVNTDGVTIAGGPSVKKDGINAGNKKVTGVADGNVAAGSTDAVNGGQLAEVKAKADSAVQDVVSSNPTALTANKVGNTVTLTPNFIAGDLVNADGTVKDPAAADEGKLVSAKTVADALKANHFVVDTKANGGKVETGSEADAKVGSGNKVTFEAGKNLVAKQANTANGGATVNYKLSDTLENLVSVKSAEIEAGIGPNKVVLNNNGVKVGDSTLNDKGLTINNGPSVTDTGIDAGNKKITGVADGNVAAGSTDAVNGGQLAAVKAKADSAVQDIKSGDEKALSVTKAGNTYTITPNLSGDLVDANGNITAPTTPADKGKLVTAGTVAEALANTHFVVDTKATDGELDAASQADQKIKASNKVTLQAGKNLKAKQTNGANGAEVEFSLKDSISLKEVKVGEGSANEVVLNNNGVNVAGNTYINKDGLNANDKKITNVAPGAVTAASKDAVNGSQLYNVANNVKDLIGPDAAIDPATGKVTVADPAKGIGETGKGNIGDAIKHVNDAAKAAAETAAKHTTVVEGKNVKVTKGKNAAGGDEYTVATKDDLDVTSVTAGNTTVNTNGLTITGGPSVTRGGIDAGNRVISGVKAGDVSATSQEAVNGSQLHATNTKLDGVKAKADTAVQDVKSGDENALTAVKDPNTNIVTVTPKLSGDLVDTNGNITAPTTPEEKGKLVTAGTVADALANTHFVVDTKATDGELDAASQADQKIKAGNKVTLQAGKNLKAKQTNGANGAQVEFSLKDSISLKEVTAGEGANQVVLNDKGVNVGGNTYINNDGLNANGNKITNVADGVDPKDAVNKGQLDAVKGVADSAVKSVDVANGEQNLVVDNSDPKNPKLSLKKDLTVDSVKAGDSTLNNDGLTIAGGPSVKKDGIDAGDKKITNVAAGDVAENSKDAVNGGQLYDVAKNVADLVGPDAKIDPATGKVTVADPAKGIGETGKGNIGDAIKHVNDLAKNAADTAKKHTTVEQGDNIVVEESLNADGGKHYKVSTAKDLNVDSVKAGDTTVNNDGVTINNGPSMTKDGINANNTKVTNVADGVDAADAVNKGQLDKVDTKVSNVAQNVVNVLGGDATVNGNGDITMSNIGETGKGNINDAIKSVNDLAKKAAAEKTSVKAKEGRSNVTVTEGVNAAGGHEYTVDVERSVTNAGSDYVTVTNNHDADTNTTTYTVDVSAKTKASLAKADSAVQGLTSKDGNLNFTKGPNGNVEVSFNDNLNVKNVTTDRVQVANGPSMSKDGINAAGKAISNVANGNVAADSKDAVNGGQLHETAKSVADVIGGGATVKDGKVVAGQNGIGNTGQNTVHGAIAAINQNTANNFNQIRGDLRKMDRDLRGGIAGALATAGLPQAFRPGKSMVAAAASTYRGQSGLAIGVSRISDNGKVILKVTGNTNSRGDFGGTIGAGYQW